MNQLLFQAYCFSVNPKYPAWEKSSQQLKRLPSLCLLWGMVLLGLLSTKTTTGQQHFQIENWRVTTFGAKEGLSQLSIFDIEEDAMGFLWLATESGLNRFNGRRFKAYTYQEGVAQGPPLGQIRSLALTPSGDLLMGTQEVGISLFEPRSDRFRHLPADLLSDPYVYDILPDPGEDNCWVATGRGLTFLAGYTEKSPTAEYYFHDPKQANSLSNNEVHCLAQGRDGNVWVGTSRGLNRYHPATQKWDRFLLRPTAEHPANHIQSLFYDQDHGYLWIGTDQGLGLWDEATQQVNLFTAPFAEASILSLTGDAKGTPWVGSTKGLYRATFSSPNSKEVSFQLVQDKLTCHSLFVDSNRHLWLGNSGAWSGLSLWTDRPPAIRLFSCLPTGAQARPFSCIRDFEADEAGQLFLATHTQGLFRVSWTPQGLPATQPIQLPTELATLGSTGISSLLKSKAGWRWLATSKQGLILQNEREKLVFLPEEAINLVYRSRDSVVWVGSRKGLRKASVSFEDGGKPQVTLENVLEDENIRALYEDQEGSLWVGCQGGGLYQIEIGSGEINHFPYEPTAAAGLQSHTILGICEDDSSYLWLASTAGLIQFDKKKGQKSLFSTEEGMPHKVIYALEQDKSGRLWLNTGYGIVRFDPKTRQMRWFPVSEEEVLEGCGNCSHKDDQGRIYMGNQKGFVAIVPQAVPVDTQGYPVVLSELRVLNRPIQAGEKDSKGTILLPHPLPYTQQLNLSHEQQVFSLSFSLLEPQHPELHRFAYKLLGQPGLEEDWVPVADGRNEVTFSGLSPGSYSLLLKGANADGYWSKSPTRLDIRIHPPFWLSNWALSTYALLGILILYGLWKNYRFRQRKKLEAQSLKLQAQQAKELTELKDQFFANVSHEFRTPLTLLIGPLRQLLEEKMPEAQHKKLSLMYRNSLNLQALINQLLDIARVEANEMKMEWGRGDIGTHLQALLSGFASLAQSRDISYHFDLPKGEFLVNYDPDKLEKIFNNLLSNAFKFTESGGKVEVKVQMTARPTGGFLLNAVVKDSGRGIPPEALPHIFERFYQTDGSATRKVGGTGIGLALTYELIRLYGGDISAESQPGKGSSFTFSLPLPPAEESTPPAIPGLQSVQAWKEAIGPADVNETGNQTASEAPLLLIAEDHPDMLAYIAAFLREDFRLILANDGEEAWAKSQEHIPDLIISDVMMPGIDGLELTRKLREDERTSHIPILLLTARASVESKVTGFETGADQYLAKPFDGQELLSRVKGLITQRQLLQARYQKQQRLDPKEMGVSSTDERFLEKLLKVLEEHHRDSNLDAESFSEKMAMSRMTLHRKLKALTGQGINEFIRKYRLQRAATLLTNKFGKVSEVAYEVGFSSPAYFSKCFKEAYHKAPSAYP
jgi:signal transduction histidine kinase/ligand-binding sensor domain-containing protein/DNA-binding response OmpR family regulator